MRKVIATVVGAFVFLSLGSTVEAKGIKVGKALRHSAAMVSAPVRHPAASVKAVSLGVFDTFLTGVESVGVVVETVGLGVEKAGVLVYDVGEVLAGAYKSNPPAPAPAPSAKP